MNLIRMRRRRTVLNIIRTLRRDANDGVAKRAVFQLPFVSKMEATTGGMQQSRMRLTMDDGFEVVGYGYDLTRASLGAILDYLTRMRRRRLM